MILVSYLIVAYKSRDSIGATIDSIQAQRGEFEQEIVVVDNYPQSNCADIVLSRNPQASVIVNRKNLGYTRGVNQVATHATGDYLFLLNPDVVLDPQCTARLLEAINSERSAAAAAPQLRLGSGEIQRSIRKFPTFSVLLTEMTGLSRVPRISADMPDWKNRGFDYSSRAVVEQPMASALLLRQNAVEKIGAWDEQFFIFFSDVDYCRRIHKSGHRILYEPTATASHIGGGATRQEGTWLIYDSHLGFYRYLCKHELLGGTRLLRTPALLLLLWGAIIRDLKRRFLGTLF